jgi:hypothetical protein
MKLMVKILQFYDEDNSLLKFTLLPKKPRTLMLGKTEKVSTPTSLKTKKGCQMAALLQHLLQIKYAVMRPFSPGTQLAHSLRY